MSLKRFNDKISTTGVYIPIHGWSYFEDMTEFKPFEVLL